MDRPAPVDWGIGRYEGTATQLLAVARVVVQRAALRAEERVLDLGCGTGNAALLAAEHGARVTGVDPAMRLLEVARGRAESQGTAVTFLPGEAGALPVDDASFEVVLSVFGVIFAEDRGAAAAEIARVLAPEGRLVLSAWIPGGALSEINAVAAETVRQALGAPPGPQPFAWHDCDALSALLRPHGFQVTVEEEGVAFVAPSAGEYLDNEFRSHPLAITRLAVLKQPGQVEALRTRMLDILENANEDQDGFRVTSRYVVATALR